jgi:hypothetical protein
MTDTWIRTSQMGARDSVMSCGEQKERCEIFELIQYHTP